MGIEVGGLLGLIILALDIWAIVKTLESGEETRHKVLWIIVIAVLPVVGLIIWYLFGPRARAAVT